MIRFIAQAGGRIVGKALREHPAVGVTLVGSIVYGGFWLRFAVFYGVFGLAPEQVGLGYLEVLARALPTLLVAVGLVIVGVQAGDMLRERWPPRGRWTLGAGEVAAWWVVVAILFIGLAGSVIFVRGQALSMVKGGPPPDSFISGIRTREATADWMSDDPTPDGLQGDLVYLGSSQGLHYLFSRSEQSSIILRADSVILHLAPSDN